MFTTGSETHGYTLSSIEVVRKNADATEANFYLCRVDSDGFPTRACVGLTGPANLEVNGTLAFAAPPNTPLKASTDYALVWIVVEDSDSSFWLSATRTNAEDAGGATGWSIADLAIFRDSEGGWINQSSGKEARITVKGTTNTSAPTNRAPAFSSTTATRSIAENTAAGENVGAPVSAQDPDIDPLTYTLGGTDAASFDIDSATGQITNLASLDYEMQASYSVTVTANDGTAMAEIAVTIMVIDLDDNPNAPAAPLVYAVSGSTSELVATWKAPFNLRKPAILSYELQYRQAGMTTWSAGLQRQTGTSAQITSLMANTVYDVQVRARNKYGDGPWSPTGTRRTLSTSNMNRATGVPTITGEALVGETLMASTETIADADGLTQAAAGEMGFAYSYEWIRVVGGRETIIPSANSNTYTLAPVDEGKQIKVKVAFNDDADNAEGPLSSAETEVVGGVLVSSFFPDDRRLYFLYVGDRDGGVNVRHAQPFTTGSATNGYLLRSVKFRVREYGGADIAAGVSIFTTNTAGSPDTVVYELEGTVDGDGDFVFHAPANATLAAGTSYLVLLEDTFLSDSLHSFRADILDSSENVVGRPGWSMGFDLETGLPHETGWKVLPETRMAIEIRGSTRRGTNRNSAPRFALSSTTLSVAENAEADTDIGMAVTAGDGDGDLLTYTLEGSDKDSFAIDHGTGQIKAKVPLDYETQSSYSVMVKADDGHGGTDTITVTIMVTDVGGPAKPAAPEVRPTPSSAASLEVIWTTPDLNGGPDITGYDIQYRVGTSGLWMNHTHSGTRTRTRIGGLAADTVHQARVRADNGESGRWSDPGTGTTLAQALNVEGDLRLLDGPDEREGRLEIFYDNEWGTVCDDRFADWNNEAAAVACRLLGYEDGDPVVRRYGRWNVSLDDQPIWLDDVVCRANEPSHRVDNPRSLFECAHVGKGFHNCEHHEDVGVRCTGDYAAPADTRGPGLRDARVDSGGLGVVLRFQETLKDNVPGTGAFTVTVTRRGNYLWRIASIDAAGTNGLGTDEIRLVGETAIEPGVLVRLRYKNPGGATAVQDVHGNVAPSFFEHADNPAPDAGQGAPPDAAPVTATFEPREPHDGSAEFEVRLSLDAVLDTSWRHVRDALSVTDGTLEGVHRIDGRSDLWGVEVTPDGDAAVTVRLAASPPCGQPGAMCTADDRRIEEPAETTVAGPEDAADGPPLTVRFTAGHAPPTEHGGAGHAFTFRLEFSEDLAPGYSYTTMRDDSLNIWQGQSMDATKAERVQPPSNQFWKITVTPLNEEPITIGLGPTFECDENGAMCTADERRLSNPLHAQVAGPAPDSAGVDGAVLVLAWASPRDGFGSPAASDYAVRVDGAARAARSARLSGRTGTLDLASPVAPGDAVTVGYVGSAMHPLAGAGGAVRSAPWAGVRVENLTGVEDAAARLPAAPAATAARPVDPIAAAPDDARVLDASGLGLADLSGVARLPALERLDLSCNALADLSPLAALGALRDLDLSGNRIADLSPLGALHALERLDVSDNAVADASALAGLPRLRVLLLDGNAVTDLGPLTHLATLENLGLAGNAVTDVTALQDLAALRRLDLGGNRIADLSPLGDVAGLVWLDVTGVPMTDGSGVGRLPALRWLFADAGTAARLLDSGSPRRVLVRPAKTGPACGSGR